MAQNEKTSLERSHSGWSNTKLTALCVVTIIVFSLLWAAAGVFVKGIVDLGTLVETAILAGLAVLTVLCLIGFNKFKR